MQSWRAADESAVRSADALVGAWVVIWLALAGWTAVSVWSLADLGTTMTAAGRSLDLAGTALQRLGELPVVGVAPAELGADVRTTAERVVANGSEVTWDVRRLSLLLGLSTFFIPVTPVLGLYLPLRLDRRREVRGLQAALDRDGDDPGLHRYLAHRAVERLPWSVVRRITPDPHRELADGRYDRLAALELRRLGIEPPDREPSAPGGTRG